MKKNKFILKIIIIILLSVSTVSFSFLEYTIFSNKLVWFYNNISLKSSDLYILDDFKEKHYLYKEKPKKLLDNTIIYKEFDNFINCTYKKDCEIFPNFQSEKKVLSILKIIRTEDKKDLINTKQNIEKEYMSIFWKYRTASDGTIYWVDRNTILYIYIYKNELRIILEDKRLWDYDKESILYWYSPFITFVKTRLLFISRFWFFKRIWYIN